MKNHIAPSCRVRFPAFIFSLLIALLSLSISNPLQAASAGPATKLIVLKRGQILDEHSPAMEYSKVDYESAFALKVILPNGQTVTVPKNQLGLVFSYPDPAAVLDAPSDIEALNAKRAEALTLAAKYPKAKPYVDRLVAQIDADVGRLTAGQVRYRGVWQARTSTPSAPSAIAGGNNIVVNGATYQRVTVTRIDNGTVSISHDGGVARIPFADATPELLQLIRAKPNLLSGTIPVGELALRGQNLKNVVLVGKQSDTLVLFHAAGVVTASSSEFSEGQLEGLTRSNPALAGQLAQASHAAGQQMSGQGQSNTGAPTTSMDVTDQLAAHLASSAADDSPAESVPLIVRRLTAEAAILGVPVQGPGGLLETLNAVSKLNIKTYHSMYGGDPAAIQILDAKLRAESVSEATVAVIEARKLGVDLRYEDALKQANAAKMQALENNHEAVAAIRLMEGNRLLDSQKGQLKEQLAKIGGPDEDKAKQWMDNLVRETTGMSTGEWVDKHGGVAEVTTEINSEEGLGLLRDTARKGQLNTAETKADFAAIARGTNLSGEELQSFYGIGVDAMQGVMDAVGRSEGAAGIAAALKANNVTAEQMGGKSAEEFAQQLAGMDSKARGGLSGAFAETKKLVGTHLSDVFTSQSGMQEHVKKLIRLMIEESKPKQSPPLFE